MHDSALSIEFFIFLPSKQAKSACAQIVSSVPNLPDHMQNRRGDYMCVGAGDDGSFKVPAKLPATRSWQGCASIARLGLSSCWRAAKMQQNTGENPPNPTAGAITQRSPQFAKHRQDVPK
jgi:hypothetical protein